MRLLLLLLLLNTTVYGLTQDSVMYAYVNSDNLIDKGSVPYIVGSAVIPGYDIEIRSCKVDETIVLPNGRMIAGLNCILGESEEYKGGLLIFNGDTTTIINMRVFPVGKDEGKFIVEGKDFDMSFTLLNGDILAYENRYCTFNTRDVGIWNIEKKD